MAGSEGKEVVFGMKHGKGFIRKLLPVLLALVICLGMLPVPVSADGTGNEAVTAGGMATRFKVSVKRSAVSPCAADFTTLQAAIDGTADTSPVDGFPGRFGYGWNEAEGQYAIHAWDDADGVRHVELLGNVGYDADADEIHTISVGRDLVFDLKGFSVDARQAGPVFTVQADITFHIHDTDGNGNERPTSSAGRITGGAGGFVGGGINAYYAEGSNVYLHGGDVTGNVADYGGGIAIGKGCAFHMSGGRVTGNTAHDGAGGVNLDACTMAMSGGEISGNVSTGYGGGIGMGNAGATLVLSGGSVSNNQAAGYGGGVYMAGGHSFRMESGMISGNTSGGSGGGVRVGSGSEFIMESGKITGNTAGNYAGGIRVGNDEGGDWTFIMNGGEISKNTAANEGGAIKADGNTTEPEKSRIEINGGSLLDNAANNSEGGAIQVWNCAVSIGMDAEKSVVIKGNRAPNGSALAFRGNVNDAEMGRTADMPLDIGPNAAIHGNERIGSEGAGAEVYVNLDRACVDLHRDSSFWTDGSFIGWEFPSYRSLKPGVPACPEEVLQEHVVKKYDPSAGQENISVTLFDYVASKDGAVEPDGTNYPDDGINKGHTFKFLGGNSPDTGKWQLSGAGVWANRLVDGFPVLSDFIPESKRETGVEWPESLKYLLNDDPIPGVKRVYKARNSMFLQDGQWFEYNSDKNFTSFTVDGDAGGESAPATGSFTVYDSPGLIHQNTVVGQFYPFTPVDGVFGYTEDVSGTKLVANRGMNVQNFDPAGWFANHHYGVKIDVDFLQPAAGKLYQYHGDTDTWSNDDMIFEFDGDDDVYVFIDGVLVLDLGGTHTSRYGSINFATGRVNAPRDEALEGVPEAYFTGTIRELFELAMGDELDPVQFSGDTFAAMSPHRMTIYYFERWNDESNFRARFNLQDALPLTLKKVGTNGGCGLPGAVYRMYKDPECTVEYCTSTESGDDGVMLFSGTFGTGVLPGTYYVKEIQAPERYEHSDEVYVLKVLDEKGRCELYNAKGERVADFSNRPLFTEFELPKTGGTGTEIFMFLGASAASASGMLLVRRKRRP